ncbi:hypothetical protein D3C86_1640230 [compost metagenome]
MQLCADVLDPLVFLCQTAIREAGDARFVWTGYAHIQQDARHGGRLEVIDFPIWRGHQFYLVGDHRQLQSTSQGNVSSFS